MRRYVKQINLVMNAIFAATCEKDLADAYKVIKEKDYLRKLIEQKRKYLNQGLEKLLDYTFLEFTEEPLNQPIEGEDEYISEDELKSK